MKRIRILPLLFLTAFISKGCVPEKTEFKIIESYNQLHILADGEHFTSYLYDTLLKKPVFYPVFSPSGIRMQRQYPLKKVEGENHDHPHHVGLFFTYGSDGEVNGNSFWALQKGKTRILHKGVTKKEVKPGMATLGTRADWIGQEGNVELVEERTMIFTGNDTERAIDFTFNLKAKDNDVLFGDTKEGMFAIRVSTWLNEEKGNGTYLSSEGDTTSGNVWGKRAKWVRLEGTHNGKKTGIVIMNHPSSVNYPTYWHARGYGLFSANPLGQSVFQKTRGEENPEPFNYTIDAGKSGLFKFKMIIYEGHRTADQIEEAFRKYSSNNLD